MISITPKLEQGRVKGNMGILWLVSHLLHDDISFAQKLRGRCEQVLGLGSTYHHPRPAQDVKEALLGGSLVSLILFFKIHAFICLFS